MNITDFRKQVTIELIAGSQYIPQEARQYIINELSKTCGGMTELTSIGYWMDEAGEVRKTEYEGELHVEETLHLTMTCEDSKLEGVYNRIQQVVQVANNMYDLQWSWIHCKLSESYGAHFKIGG